MSALERRLGELRPTQLILSYGIGSIIDLPHFSVMLLGLEDWPTSGPITEERLLRAVQARLGPQVERLVSAPVEQEQGLFSPTRPALGIPVVTFPRWMRCPFCALLAPISRFQLRTTPGRPDKAQYIHHNCQKAKDPSVVPARFLIACENGHIDDFPWHSYLHDPGSKCPGDFRLDELGGTEATDVRVRCVACGVPARAMADAFERTHKITCRGRRPHLRDFEQSGCPEPAKAILLGTSNTWFADALSVLHVPHAATDKLAKLVEGYWSKLEPVTDISIVRYLLSLNMLPLLTAAKYTAEEIWQSVEDRKKGAVAEVSTDLKVPEWQAFSKLDPSQMNTDFDLVESKPPQGFESIFRRVVLARRLREVTALVGFSRLESKKDGSTRKAAPLTRMPPTFVPASEVRGEGIFLEFDDERLSKWCDQQEGREKLFFTSHRAWRARRKIEPPEGSFPGYRFVVLHSFAHALIRQLALECGYGAASLRERIYANDGSDGSPRMAGVLIYTAAPDSEGTLGGLVRMGAPAELSRHIRQALEDIRLCSSDPLCADNVPDGEGVTVHGASCHACLFASETSCERGNRYLDRSALVATVSGVQGFFDEVLR